MLTGIDRPTSGEVHVGGTAVHKLSEGKLAKWRGKQMGIVFQFFQLLPTLTLVENVMLPMDLCGLYSVRERKKRAMGLLDLVEMGEQAHKLPTAISGGQQQRVAIARALANEPPLLLADEPTGNLDTSASETVLQAFRDIRAMGTTILIVTHDPNVASSMERLVSLVDGHIAADFDPHSSAQMAAVKVIKEKRATAEMAALMQRAGTPDN